MNRDIGIIRFYYYPSELNIKREAEALLSAGHKVCVICARKENEKIFENINGIKVYRIPIKHKRAGLLRYIFEYAYFFINATIKVTKLYLRRKFYAIQVNTMPDFLVFSTLIPKLFGAKIVLHIQEPAPELWKVKFGYNLFMDKLLKMVRKWAIIYADHILTVTQQLKETLITQKVSPSKITVILNVPDENIFIPYIKKDVYIKKQKNKFKIITHGAIEKRYGLETVIKAVNTLKEKLPGLQYYILGDGSYEEELKHLVKMLNIENYVEFVGFLPFKEMINYIKNADIGIVPMQKNPYSDLVHTNKMFEYIMFKKTTIASRLKAVEAYFPDNAVMYFEPENAQDLADKILYLYNHPEEREKLVKNASKIYEKYKWSKMKEIYLDVYRKLLKEK